MSLRSRARSELGGSAHRKASQPARTVLGPSSSCRSGVKGKKTADDVKRDFAGASVVFGDVSNADSLASAVRGKQFDVVVSCLASRTGGKKDSWLIDYQATRNSLDVGRANGAKHFVLLSAICVQKPELEFQRAKLKFEGELQAAGDVTYSIVRPTAFMKSIAGQVDNVKKGVPYVMFGDGTLCACKPISEADLASFMAECISDPAKSNQMLPIGGPGRAYTPLDQANVLFRVAGLPNSYIRVPIGIMDGAVALFDWLASKFPQLEDPAEFAKIGRYYAVESMLVYDPVTKRYDADATPSYGKDTLESVFTKLVKEGTAGQELGDAAVFGVTRD